MSTMKFPDVLYVALGNNRESGTYVVFATGDHSRVYPELSWLIRFHNFARWILPNSIWDKDIRRKMKMTDFVMVRYVRDTNE